MEHFQLQFLTSSERISDRKLRVRRRWPWGVCLTQPSVSRFSRICGTEGVLSNRCWVSAWTGERVNTGSASCEVVQLIQDPVQGQAMPTQSRL